MSEAPFPEPPPARAPGAVRSRRPPAWGIGVFLLLLAGLVFINQRVSTGGKPIAWIDNDFTAALQQAETEKRKVFLYLYEPNDPTHDRNERQVFTQLWAREPLAHVVCCRVALGPGDSLRFRYKYNGQPLFLLLDAKGNVLSRVEGAVDELQFFTNIGTIAERQ